MGVWLDIRKKNQRGPGLFKVNGSLLEDPNKLRMANENITRMMQQMDPTWDPHKKLEYFKVCVRSTMSELGQITSSMEAQELIQLETQITNLYNLKEQMVLNTAAPNDFTTQEVEADIEIIKAQIGIIKNKQTERLMFRSRVKWYSRYFHCVLPNYT